MGMMSSLFVPQPELWTGWPQVFGKRVELEVCLTPGVVQALAVPTDVVWF